jgi:hypothetical protein
VSLKKLTFDLSSSIPPAPDGMPGRYFAAAPAAQQLKLAARLQIGFRPI